MLQTSNSRQSIHFSPPYWGKIILFGLVYFGLAQLGFLLPFSQGEIATLAWPATAVSLAALLLFGFDLWPGLTIGAILVAISNSHSLPLLLSIVITHTIETISSVWLIRKYYPNFDRTLERLQDIRIFILMGALLAPALGATLGVLSFAISPEGIGKNLINLWWQWWAGHAMSNLIITPAILTWAIPATKNRLGTQSIELILVYAALLLTGFLVFIRLPSSTSNLPLGHVVFPFLLWLALRFSPREVAGASLMVSIIAIIGTVHGTGPFSRPLMATNLLLLLTFVVAVMLTSLIISSIMTERRKAQHQLQQRHDQLETRVAERTADLSITNQQLHQEIEERNQIEAELAQARDQAVEALQLKSQILANVSHDARTPLNVIMLYTQILQKAKAGPLTEKQAAMLDTILLSSHDLLHFINNLLDEAHLQTNKTIIQTADIHLQQWLNERKQVLQPLAQHKGIELKIELDDNMPSVIQADPEGIKQIFNNLVDNAIKFTNKGTVIAKISKFDEQHWAMHIEDTGCGIPQEAQGAIFDAFWQVDGSNTREVNRGIGLGLSIVKQRINLLGGSIHLHSKLAEGSVFTAVFPLRNGN